MDWEYFGWVTGCTVGGFFAGAMVGAVYMQRLVKGNVEFAIRQDHRISNNAKARLIARVRGCPAEWVIEEMHQERLHKHDNEGGA